MIDLLFQALGNSIEHSAFKTLNGIVTDFSASWNGAKARLCSIEYAINLTFDDNEMLSKIELTPGLAFKMWMEKMGGIYCEKMNQHFIIHILGEPTSRMNFPPHLGSIEQFLYDKQDYWVGIKFNQSFVENMTIMLPSLISENIRNQSFPIRTCKSKK